jgi:hypothetical protein
MSMGRVSPLKLSLRAAHMWRPVFDDDDLISRYNQETPDKLIVTPEFPWLTDMIDCLL